MKEEPVDELVTAIEVIANGRTYFSRLALSQLTQTEGKVVRNLLTEREQEILQFMAQGMNNQQIAKALSITDLYFPVSDRWQEAGDYSIIIRIIRKLITDRTVKFHTTNIYDKLGGLSRAETIAWAWKNGMMNNDEA